MVYSIIITPAPPFLVMSCGHAIVICLLASHNFHDSEYFWNEGKRTEIWTTTATKKYDKNSTKWRAKTRSQISIYITVKISVGNSAIMHGQTIDNPAKEIIKRLN